MVSHASRVKLLSRFLVIIVAAATLLIGGVVPASASSHKTHRVHIAYHVFDAKVTHYKDPPRVDAAGQLALTGNTPQHCPAVIYYAVTSSEPVFMVDKQDDVFENGPGGTVSWRLDETTKTTTSASGSVSIDIPIVTLITAAKLTVSAKVVKTVTKKLDMRKPYVLKIPPHDLGFIAYGSFGYKITWAAYALRGACSYPEVAHGTGLVPTKKTGWHGWLQKA